MCRDSPVTHRANARNGDQRSQCIVPVPTTGMSKAMDEKTDQKTMKKSQGIFVSVLSIRHSKRCRGTPGKAALPRGNGAEPRWYKRPPNGSLSSLLPKGFAKDPPPNGDRICRAGTQYRCLPLPHAQRRNKHVSLLKKGQGSAPDKAAHEGV